MSAALPPVTDCGCSSTTSSSTTASTCCPLSGTLDPNVAGYVGTSAWQRYTQLADLVNGPPVQLWYWNVNLAVWQ